ncbi:MAG: tRNA (adenosine(37)-N6)-threonylcarbamoyltransferase complex transferase subunit TsaD [Patescibacteria group bacterium]
MPVLEDCVTNACTKLNCTTVELVTKIDAVAVTVGPGLIGSLLVGVNAAKALALAWNKPLLPINHLVGHLYANFLNGSTIPQLPALGLVISGGHTDLVVMHDHNNLEYIGGTLDDAAGEAFDKTARLLNIKAFMGGKELSNLASSIKVSSLNKIFPRPLIDSEDFNFSFSGLKTAVRYFIQNNEDFSKPVLAAEFEQAVVDVVVDKTLRAISKHNVSTLLVGGGVAANRVLRERLQSNTLGVTVHVPPIYLCMDHPAYIATAAYWLYKDTYNTYLLKDIEVNPSLTITSSAN